MMDPLGFFPRLCIFVDMVIEIQLSLRLFIFLCKKQIYYHDPFVERLCLFSNGRAKPLESAIRLLRFVTAKCPLNRVEQMTDGHARGVKKYR